MADLAPSSPRPDRAPSEIEGAFDRLNELLTLTEEALLVLFPSNASGVFGPRTSLRSSLANILGRTEDVASQVIRLADMVGPVQD